MNAAALAACVAVMTMLGLVLWCLDLRDEAAATQAARARHPSMPRRFAWLCECCAQPIRYQIHPTGQEDAVALHLAYECQSSSLIRRKQDT